MKASWPPSKPALPDGFQCVDVVASYTSAIDSWRKHFPALFAARFAIALAPKKGLKPKLRAALKIAKWWLEVCIRGRAEDVPLPACDVVLYYSSRKPSFQPAIDMLAERLSRRGIWCAVLCPSRMEIWSASSGSGSPNIQPVPAYKQLFQHGSSRLIGLKSLCQSFWIACVLFTIILLKRPGLLTSVFANPFGVWCDLLGSLLRFRAAQNLLRGLRPKMIVTSGEHVPFAAELLLCDEGTKTYRACFFNEHPTAAMLPILSNEVWVWNDLVSEVLRGISSMPSNASFSVVGNAQVDFALQHDEGDEARWQQLQGHGRFEHVVLFLSEYDGSEAVDTSRLMAESLHWLAHAARECSGWCFIYKARPFHFDKDVPGQDFFRRIPNFVLPDCELSLTDYLSWSKVRAVAACGSTGLFVAAGAGKVALRLLPSSTSVPLPVIDDVSFAVHSAEELVQALRRIELGNLTKPSRYLDRAFPYRGCTLDRMESLCLERLSELQKNRA